MRAQVCCSFALVSGSRFSVVDAQAREQLEVLIDAVCAMDATPPARVSIAGLAVFRFCERREPAFSVSARAAEVVKFV